MVVVMEGSADLTNVYLWQFHFALSSCGGCGGSSSRKSNGCFMYVEMRGFASACKTLLKWTDSLVECDITGVEVGRSSSGLDVYL